MVSVVLGKATGQDNNEKYPSWHNPCLINVIKQNTVFVRQQVTSTGLGGLRCRLLNGRTDSVNTCKIHLGESSHGGRTDGRRRRLGVNILSDASHFTHRTLERVVEPAADRHRRARGSGASVSLGGCSSGGRAG